MVQKIIFGMGFFYLRERLFEREVAVPERLVAS
jgi:hypothetical protein